MIRISRSDLEQGLAMAQGVSQCRNAIHCLWGKLTTDITCQWSEQCELIRFRKIFEQNSPALFGKSKELSEYESITYDLVLTEKEGDSDQKREVRVRFRDLNIFAQVLMIALYSLFLANNQTFPFISVKEIKETEEKFSGLLNFEVGEIALEPNSVNQDWFNWICSTSTNFDDVGKWSNAIFLLIKLFIKEAEKTLPIGIIDEEKLFSDLEFFLASKSK